MINQRSPARTATWIALLHTVLVVGAISGKYLLSGSSVRWPGERMLRFIDFPVLWLIDPAMQSFSLPPEWFYPRLFVALAVHESIAYAVIGGTFYAAVAAAITFARHRKQNAAVEGSRPA